MQIMSKVTTNLTCSKLEYDKLDKKCTCTARLCSNGARSLEATNIWPRATQNIFLVARPGDWLVLVS